MFPEYYCCCKSRCCIVCFFIPHSSVVVIVFCCCCWEKQMLKLLHLHFLVVDDHIPLPPLCASDRKGYQYHGRWKCFFKRWMIKMHVVSIDTKSCISWAIIGCWCYTVHLIFGWTIIVIIISKSNCCFIRFSMIDLCKPLFKYNIGICCTLLCIIGCITTSVKFIWVWTILRDL